MKMGRWLRCSSVTHRLRYAPSSRPAAAGPAAHFDRNESHVIHGIGHLSRSPRELVPICDRAVMVLNEPDRTILRNHDGETFRMLVTKPIDRPVASPNVV